MRFQVATPAQYLAETQGTTDVVMTLLGPGNDTTAITENDDIGPANRNSRIQRAR